MPIGSLRLVKEQPSVVSSLNRFDCFAWNRCTGSAHLALRGSGGLQGDKVLVGRSICERGVPPLAPVYKLAVGQAGMMSASATSNRAHSPVDFRLHVPPHISTMRDLMRNNRAIEFWFGYFGRAAVSWRRF